ncbi:MAG: molybdopterin-dependent oxidoreductase [Desulfobacteraceae bacterium]
MLNSEENNTTFNKLLSHIDAGTSSRREFIKSAIAIGSLVGINGISSVCNLIPRPLLAAVDEDVKTTVCSLCGHALCGLKVHVKNDRIYKVEGLDEHPDNKGLICSRGKNCLDIIYARDRLKYPLKRAGKKGEGKWKRVSWDEALDTIAENFQQTKTKYGAESVNFHWGHFRGGELKPYLWRLANVFGTPNVTSTNHVCGLPRVLIELITFGAVYAPDVQNTKCMMLWGGNPAKSLPSQTLSIKKAMDDGAKIIVVDPRKIGYAKKADLHAQLRPGTDGAFALGMLNVIIKEGLYDKSFVQKHTLGFERLSEHVKDYPPEKVENITWVPSEVIKKIARIYATTKPACINLRNGIDQHTNCSQSLRAICSLMAVTGNLGIKGGNSVVLPLRIPIALLKGLQRASDIYLNEKLPPEMNKKRLGADIYLTDYLKYAHIPSVWDAILKEKPYPVKSMFVMAANPAVVCANTKIVENALNKLGFLVVTDLFMNETAKFADIVLPACSFLETTYYASYDIRPDVMWNTDSLIMLRPKMIEPIGESRSDWDIICELGRRMGYEEYFQWKCVEEAIDYELEPINLTCKDLSKHPYGIQSASVFTFLDARGHGERSYKLSGFLTPSKKVELYSERLKTMGHNPLPVYEEPAESPISRPDLTEEYPLILTTGAKVEMYTHSQMRNIASLKKLMPENLIEINPGTAKEAGVYDGDMAVVESPRGRIKCKVLVTEDIPLGIVHIFHGFGNSNVNNLIDDRIIDPITGSVGMKSSLCKVIKEIKNES